MTKWVLYLRWLCLINLEGHGIAARLGSIPLPGLSGLAALLGLASLLGNLTCKGFVAVLGLAALSRIVALLGPALFL